MTDGDHACDCRPALGPLRRSPVVIAGCAVGHRWFAVCSSYPVPLSAAAAQRLRPVDDRLNGEPFHAPMNSSAQPRSGQSATVPCLAAASPAPTLAVVLRICPSSSYHPVKSQSVPRNCSGSRSVDPRAPDARSPPRPPSSLSYTASRSADRSTLRCLVWARDPTGSLFIYGKRAAQRTMPR